MHVRVVGGWTRRLHALCLEKTAGQPADQPADQRRIANQIDSRLDILLQSSNKSSQFHQPPLWQLDTQPAKNGEDNLAYQSDYCKLSISQTPDGHQPEMRCLQVNHSILPLLSNF